MTTLSLTNPTPSTLADANVIASNNNAILAVVNGGIDNTNIASGAGIGISKLAGYPADGTKVLKGDGSWATITTGPTITYATSLPGSPASGDICYLVDSTTSPTYAWTFRYNASSVSTYKWEFVGGAPIITVASSYTVPRAGDYNVMAMSGYGNGGTTTGRYLTLQITQAGAGVGPTVGVDAANSGGTGTGASQRVEIQVASRLNGISAGQVIGLAGSGGSPDILWVQPIRVI